MAFRTQPRLRLIMPRADRSGHKESSFAQTHGIFPESGFRAAIALERKRAERSGKRFLLMLLGVQPLINDNRDKVRSQVVSAVCAVTRESDLAGWHSEGSELGVIFTELGEASDTAVCESIRARAQESLLAELDAKQVGRISITFHFFPGGPEEDLRQS